eukprot:scaffold1178_cov252-Pinguiococcus_pyrenoidosus.AAC.1
MHESAPTRKRCGCGRSRSSFLNSCIDLVDRSLFQIDRASSPKRPLKAQNRDFEILRSTQRAESWKTGAKVSSFEASGVSLPRRVEWPAVLHA